MNRAVTSHLAAEMWNLHGVELSKKSLHLGSRGLGVVSAGCHRSGSTIPLEIPRLGWKCYITVGSSNAPYDLELSLRRKCKTHSGHSSGQVTINDLLTFDLSLPFLCLAVER